MCTPGQMQSKGSDGNPFHTLARGMLLHATAPNDPRRAMISRIGQVPRASLGAASQPTVAPATLGGR